MMNNEYMVSVVIPTHNAEKFIRDCLDATVTQTYSNIEILIVDDGSEDSTINICKEYINKDNRIKLFISENKGVSVARNIGIDNASGRYIVFFDSDDRPETDILESYLNAAEEWADRPVALITCGMFYDNMYNRNVDDRIHILESKYGYIKGENYLLKRNYVATLAWLKIFNFVTNKLYDNKIIDAFGIRFDENINIGEDLQFNLDYLDICKGYIGMINRPLYHYIKRSEISLSITYHENDIEDTKAIYRRLLEWESKQEDVTEDNMLVLKSIFLTDWTSRLTTMHDYFKKQGNLEAAKQRLNSEAGSNEFQNMLRQVHNAKKISALRYCALRLRSFNVFCFLRSMYQLTKG